MDGQFMMSSSFSSTSPRPPAPVVVDGPSMDVEMISSSSSVSCLNSAGTTGFMSTSRLQLLPPGPNYYYYNDSIEKQKPDIESMEMYMRRRRSSMARKRRQKISEKIRCLQKILPWDKKMNIATMLEEAYKYIQFLQAQLLVLHSIMPPNCNSSSPEQLQVLDVVVNSKVAQTVLYSRGWCVYSVEQLILFMTSQIKDQDQVFFDPPISLVP